MHDPHAAFAATPVGVLDSYVDVMHHCGSAALVATALRTRSVQVRELFARAVGADLGELLTTAMRGGGVALGSDAGSVQALIDLGRVVALQDVLPGDRADGVALLDYALARYGRGTIPPAHQGLHAQLALQLGHYDKAAQLCEIYPEMPSLIRHALLTDLANPFLRGAAGDEATWLDRFQRLFPYPAAHLRAADGHPALDRLTPDLAPAPEERGDAANLITVIVTTFEPDESLLTAVRSLLCQTWQAVEVLVVDDASSSHAEPVLRQCAGMDSRVRLVRRETNGGTYRARNTGLDLARGSFVTFQDSDDWSHPARLEHQVRPLLEHPDLVGTVVDTLNVTEQLVLTRPGRDLLVPIPTQMMFRRQPVMSRIGYFDGVRKAADTEYQRRIEAVFGPASVHRLGEAAYALHRVRSGSLSEPDFGPGWVHPGRTAYWAAYGVWHEQIRTGRRKPYLPREPARRPFAVPAHIRGGAAGDPRVYDVIYAGDWRGHGPAQRGAVDELSALARRGLRVGLLQLEAVREMSPRRFAINGCLQELINDATVDQVVLTDEAVASLMLIRSPDVLQFPTGTPSTVRATHTVIVADEAPTDGAGARYAPDACSRTATGLFSAAPSWCPMNQAARDELARIAGDPLTRSDFRYAIDPARWRMRRRGPGHGDPVIGVHGSSNPADWPADRAVLEQVYPEVDVRIWGNAEVPRALLGSWQMPPHWLVYRTTDTTLRSFLHQLDMYVYFPRDPQRDPGIALLEALAAGCVVIVPEQFAEMLGDGAVYCDPSQVRDVIAGFQADPERFLKQSQRATARAWTLGDQDQYVEVVTALAAATADAADAVPAREPVVAQGGLS